MSKSIEEFKGVIPAVLSIFDKDENLDEQGTRAFIRYLCEQDIGGLYLTGSTGEAFLMDAEERMRQVEIVMDEVAGKLPVVVHVGDIGTKKSIALARHAEKCGVAGISSVPPFYFNFTLDQIVGYYKDLADATDLPLIVYNISLAGMMSMDTVCKLSRIENIKGVKYTGTALYEVEQMQDQCTPGFRIYGGCDQLGSSNIALGVTGIIGTFYNCIADLYAKIWHAVKEGDQKTATVLQRKAQHVIDLGVNSGSMMACVKAWLRRAGINAGYARRPFTNFTPAEEKALCDQLLLTDEQDEIGLDIVKRIKAN